MTLRAAEEHYRQQAALAALVARRMGQLWARVPESDVNVWRSLERQALSLVSAGQFAAASVAAGYVSAALDEQGADVAPEADVRPAGFVGMPNPEPPADLIDLPRIQTLQAIEQGAAAGAALTAAGMRLQTYATTLVQDAGRQADSVATFARPRVGWVRMVNPPCCERCAILAGKWFKSNQGFQRHPRCDCRHVPAAEDSPGDVGTDPDALFRSGQVRGLRVSEAQAIREGADPAQVVNARRGSQGMTTTESTTRRGRARRGRLTPDGIYAQAGDDRDRALTLLREHGYIL